jgi:type IV pilus assembly protein PilQ
MSMPPPSSLLVVLSLAAGPGPPGPGPAGPAEARVSLDVREAPVQEIVRALADLGGFQVVFDHDVRCSLTVKLQNAAWLTALDATLRACRLERDEGGGVVRVAPIQRLRQEAESRRRLSEAREAARSGDLVLFRLSYARAEAMLPLLRELVAPRGQVTLDPRTNTLIVRY